MKKILFALLFTACGDGNIPPNQPDAQPPTPDTPGVTCQVTPGAWSSPSFATNAAEALALRAQLDLLTGAMTMRGAEQGTVVVDDVADLDAVYNGGTPALSSIATPAMDAVVDDAFAAFVPAVLAGPRDLIDDTGWNPGADGGIFGARLAGFNIGAIEVRQIVDKGLFAGGGLYRYALGLTEGTIYDAMFDKLAAAWGSNATLDPMMMPQDSANYSFRMGFHAGIAKALTDARAYAADPDCVAERDAALVAFFRLWEHSMMARAVHYGNAGVSKLALATTDDARVDALHEYAEGMGLAIGFHGLAHPASGPLAGAGRVISDADLDAILTGYGVNRTNLGASTLGSSYVTDTLSGGQAFQTGVTAAETRVKQVYQLTDADIAAYRAAVNPG